MSEGFREVWYTDESDAMWMLDGSLATPASREQGFSVATAIRNGILPGRVDPDSGLGGIALSTLAEVIEDEAGEPGAEVAGFEQWPREPGPPPQRLIAGWFPARSSPAEGRPRGP